MKTKGRSFTDYLAAKKLAVCPICKIPAPLLAELTTTIRSRNIRVADALEWLRVEHGIRVTVAQYMFHCKASHAQAQARLKGK